MLTEIKNLESITKGAPSRCSLLVAPVKKYSGSHLGNATGYPGVFQGNPSPHPWKPTPAATGAGFCGYGVWVFSNPRGPKPVQGYSTTSSN
jgi:hypothetical protein